MFNSLTFSYRVPYKLKPFSYCRLLNDRVRSASVTLDTKSDSKYSEKFREIPFHLFPEETYYKKIEFKYCLRCIPFIRRWKTWIFGTENKYKLKFTCYPSYNNKYTSEVYFMSDEEVKSTKKDLIFHLSNLNEEMYPLKETILQLNPYQLKRIKYLIQEQNQVRNKLKNLLGEEKYSQLGI